MTGKKTATFRERFIELINSSPKSRTVIAQEFGVAKQTISAWITGQSSPRLPVATALAEYFDVNLAWLLGYDVSKHIDKDSLEKYESIVEKSINNSNRLSFILDDEFALVNSYRALSPRGQRLLLERADELKVLYGKKSEDHPAQSV